jgi:hypothetical protein
MRRHFGSLRNYGGINVHDSTIPGLGQKSTNFPQQLRRVSLAIALIAGRKVDTNVGQTGRPQKGIHYSMQQNIGVAVPLKTHLERNLNAPDNQPPPGNQTVNIEPVTDSEFSHLLLPSMNSATSRSW